jgi:hypothetical protein
LVEGGAGYDGDHQRKVSEHRPQQGKINNVNDKIIPQGTKQIVKIRRMLVVFGMALIQGGNGFRKAVQQITMDQILQHCKYSCAAQKGKDRTESVKIQDGENQTGYSQEDYETNHGTGQKLSIVLQHVKAHLSHCSIVLHQKDPKSVQSKKFFARLFLLIHLLFSTYSSKKEKVFGARLFLFFGFR